MTEIDVAIVGGGPAGLSAALLTAKNGLHTIVFDTDDTAMNKARLRNYLGVENVMGDEFMAVAREQVDDHGADRRQGEAVSAVERTDAGFRVTTDEGGYDAPYVVLASGYPCDLAAELGCELGKYDTVAVDVDCETTVENAYAVGEAVRMPKIQAAISVGHGATAAIDILWKERNEPFHDYDKAVHAQ
ncbi:FAD-dependent oxidoreductase (plasmid) [Halococcus dombrowskii]|uniref:FAD-dependent oxidoreductase n=1 Tax=Halococcus dombrowskii TaxID=179637 RepID=A0AAV3SJB8_HALDO|nr:FAD-dependent oxidoreductase [Halococcus dombrowskii]UOO97027.1 FAD-dependent oxidoreductase [Halococcus dombrowskii]